MAIKDWSTTAGSNNSSPPDGAPEGMAPSTVNNTMREMMAQVRGWYEDPEWINYGYTYTYVATTQFKISGSDQTSKYPVGRRVRAVGSTTGTIYGTISVSSFSTDTTITVVWDSGSLSNETLQVSVGNPSSNYPQNMKNIFSLEDSIASATTTDLGSKTSNILQITGTTTITSFGSSASTNAPIYFVRFSGILTLTYNATSLILPGASNITTASGDTGIFKYEGSGNWRCIVFLPIGGYPSVSSNNVWSGTNKFTGGLYLGNAQFLRGEQSGGGVFDALIGLSTGNDTIIRAGTGNDIKFQDSSTVDFGSITSAGLMTMNAGMINGVGSRSLSISMADDTATSFTPLSINGQISAHIRNSPSDIVSVVAIYGTQSGTAYMTSIFTGTGCTIGTGTLSGTTGTDVKLNIRAHTDGKIYIENRRGGTVTVDISIT